MKDLAQLREEARVRRLARKHKPDLSASTRADDAEITEEDRGPLNRKFARRFLSPLSQAMLAAEVA